MADLKQADLRQTAARKGVGKPGPSHLARLLLMILPLLLTFCAGEIQGTDELKQAENVSEEEPPMVTAVPARYIHRKEAFTLFGTAYARREYRIIPEEGGRTGNVFVREGDLVQSGDPLIQMDKTDLQELMSAALLKLQIADMEIKLARIALEDELSRAHVAALLKEKQETGITLMEEEKSLLEEDLQDQMALHKSGAVSLEQIKEGKHLAKKLDLELRSLQIELEIADHSHPDPRGEETLLELKLLEKRQIELGIESLERRIENCLLRSPGKGIVSGIVTTPGDLLPAGTPAMVLFDPSSVEIRIAAPNRHFPRIITGGGIIFPGTMSSSNEPLQGEVGGIIPRSDEQGRFTILGRASTGKGLPLLPGSRHEVMVEAAGQVRGIVMEPGMVLETEGSASYLLLVEHGRLRFREVETEQTVTGSLWIMGGPREGELICTSLPSDFHEGMKVHPDVQDH